MQLNGERFKIPYIKRNAGIYDALLRTAINAPSEVTPEFILSVVEKCRAREIAELVGSRSSSLKEPSRNRSVLAEQLRGLREELSWYYHQSENAELSTEGRSVRAAEDLQRAVCLREEALTRTLETMRHTDEEFHSLRTASSMPVKRIQQSLMDDETLLEFFEIQGSVRVCLLTQTTCEIVPLTRIFSLRALLRRLFDCFATTELDATDSDARNKTGFEKTLEVLEIVHAALIGPILGRLQGRRLIMAPAGLLRYVPFHALFDGTLFLIDRHVLSYTGSGSQHCIGASKIQVLKGRDLLVDSLELGDTPPDFPNFIAIPGIEGIRQPGSSNRFIHLNCRMLPRLDNPMFSTLRIGESEIRNLDLFSLDLSCSVLGVTGSGSGLSAEADGKELEGFARALEYAGARSLILPLWNTRGNSGRFLFQKLYENASESSDVALAFQATLAQVRERFPDPYHWAAFVLRGQTGRPRTWNDNWSKGPQT